MTGKTLEIRAFAPEDVEAVWRLMRDLAVFEGYIDAFRVTAADLLEHGFGPNPAFGVFVAVYAGTIVGIAVHYRIPWTFDLKPVVVLKEFFVAHDFRSHGVGAALFSHLRRYASGIGASALRWAVLPGNEGAMRFYSAQGGEKDAAWDYWMLRFPATEDASQPEAFRPESNERRTP